MPENFDQGQTRHNEHQDMQAAIEAYPDIYELYKRYQDEAPDPNSDRQIKQEYKERWSPILQKAIEDAKIPTAQLNLIIKKIIIDKEGHM